MLSDDEFRTLLDRLDRPWAGFRKVRKGVKKRVRRHMAALGCPRIEDYLRRLDQDPAARAECDRQLQVTISRFLRDRRLWDRLQDFCLPRMLKRFPGGLAAWSAGCAGGEEPYSLAMIWAETAAKMPAAADLRILATDADTFNLRRAREGRYPPGSLKEVPEALKQRWFESERGGRRMRIDARLRAQIEWRIHDLLDEPPSGPFHLILLRNSLLTYYQGVRLQTAFARIVEHLLPAGLLITGSHEHLPEGDFSLVRDVDCPWIYRKFGMHRQS